MDYEADQITDPLLAMLKGFQTNDIRPDLEVSRIPSPKGLAPQSVAFAINVAHTSEGTDHGSSRLVVAYDPDIPEGWHSALRIIGYAKSRIDLEMAKDEYLANLPWEWLKDSLRASQAAFGYEAGTSTIVVSTGHGSLVSQPQYAELELRASWTPLDSGFTRHVLGWAEMVALISGLPPSQNEVARLGRP